MITKYYNSYKSITYNFLRSFPLKRINKFKRSKWKFVKSLLSRRFKNNVSRLDHKLKFDKRREINYLNVKDILENHLTDLIIKDKNKLSDSKKQILKALIILKGIKAKKIKYLSFKNLKLILGNFFWRQRLTLLIALLLKNNLIIGKKSNCSDESVSILDKSFLKSFIKNKESLKDFLFHLNSIKFKVSRRVKKQSKKFIKTRKKNLILLKKKNYVISRQIRKLKLRSRLSLFLKKKFRSQILEYLKNLDSKNTSKLKSGLKTFKRCFPVKNSSNSKKFKPQSVDLLNALFGKRIKGFRKLNKGNTYSNKGEFSKKKKGVIRKRAKAYILRRYKRKKSFRVSQYKYLKAKWYPKWKYRMLKAQNSKKIKPIFLKGFRQAKWFRVRKYRRNAKFRRALPNFNKLSFKKRRWLKKKQISKFSLSFKKSVVKFHDNSTPFNFYKRQKNLTSKGLSKLIVKPLLRLDVLLWKLGFFPSVRAIRQEMIKKNILVNGKAIKKSCFLKKGDIVKVLSKGYNSSSDFAKRNFYFSFCEIDFYTRSVVLLRNAEDFRPQDYSFIFRQRIKESLLIRYLRRN